MTCLLVAALGLLPVIRDPWWYYTDDAATQILPMWYTLGERIRAGIWPPMLDLHSWMGGNLAVETLFGIWNPANAVLWVAVSLTPNLAISAIAVRLVAFVLLALGCYGLCREYGAARWAASTVAVALPFCGPLFYFDAAKWPAALVAFVWIPFLWWAARRLVRGVTNVFWVFVLGALAITAGNPYTTLAACMVLLGLHLETAVRRQWVALRRLLPASLTIVSIAPLVYLPLLLSTNVTWRAPGGIGYSGVLTPHLRDLVNSSVPGYVPAVPDVTDAAVYFCWFAAPLAVWLDWSVLRARWRELTGALVVACGFVIMARGPSELWMFRWPLRVLHYGYLGAAILLAVLLSAGPRTNHLRWRVLGTTGLMLVSAGLIAKLTQDPRTLPRGELSLCLVALLAATALWAYRGRGVRWLAAVLHGGTVITFLLQLWWFLGYHGTTPYYFPTSVTQMRAEFAPRYRGGTIQIADTDLIGPPSGPRQAWRDLVPGNLYRPARIDTLGAYTGMGFRPFAESLCMDQIASTCPGAYDVLWRPPPGISVPLADLLRLDTVVVQRKLLDLPRIPAGWRIAERGERVTLLRRQLPIARSGGRLSWVSPDVRVVANATFRDEHEVVQFRRSGPGPGRLLFARLAWPGYRAKIGSLDAGLRDGPAGLLEVDLPPGVNSGRLDVTWRPPGLHSGLAFGIVGGLTAILLGVLGKFGGVAAFRPQVSRARHDRPGLLLVPDFRRPR